MAGIDAFGTQFLRGDGATPTEVFSALANVNNIAAPSLTRSVIDVTAHDSPDAWMESVGGLKDGGEVTIDLNYDPAAHDSLVADLSDENPRNYRIVFPDPGNTAWTFPGILTAFQATAPIDDKLTASLTYKVAGKPTLA
ncbi:phage tail tube protein [Streptomyces sp. NPDC057854]|uniref:phage tail tube protein n=1 Tax=unclassified Streptomyces TaxID=2593676 RepID=UPI0036934105